MIETVLSVLASLATIALFLIEILRLYRELNQKSKDDVSNKKG